MSTGQQDPQVFVRAAAAATQQPLLVRTREDEPPKRNESRHDTYTMMPSTSTAANEKKGPESTLDGGEFEADIRVTIDVGGLR